jgi:hypothetical protein
MLKAEMRGRVFAVAALAIVALGAVLRFDALGSGLPNQHTRPDELPVVLEMARPARGDFALELVIYPHAYVYATWLWVEAGLALAPLFGLEPPGGFERTLLGAPEQLFLIGRTMSATAGTLAVLLAVALARREWGDGTALAAGLLVATCFLHARDSHALKPDALLSLGVLVSLLACVRLAERVSLGSTLTAGAALGLATAAKYTGVLMAVPVYVAGCMAGTRAGSWRMLSWPGVAACLAGAAVFALSSPWLVFGGPLPRLARAMLGMVLPDLFPATDFSGGPPLLAPLEPVPPGIDLQEFAKRPWYHGLVFHASFSFWYGAGALATVLAPFALAFGFASRRPLPVLTAVACSVQLLVMALTPAVTARYVTPALPMLLVLEAALLARLASRLAPRRRSLVLAALSIAVCAQPLAAILAHNRIASETDTRVLASGWMREHLSPGTRLAYSGAVLMPYGQPTPPRGMPVVAHGLDPAALDAARADVLVTHEHSLYFSTVDSAALEALAPRLELIADFDPGSGADGSRAVFEDTDAYYIPVHGFGAVSRPGPHVRIYRYRRGVADR